MRFEHSGLAAGLLVRVLWALTVEVAPLSDSHAYDTFARMMVDHDICGWEPDEPTPYWPVGTAAVIAALYALFGESYAVIAAFNVLVSLAATTMVYKLALDWFGRGAAFALALWPSLVMYVTVIASEVFFMACTLAGLLFWGSRAALGAVAPGRALLGGRLLRLAVGAAAAGRPAHEALLRDARA